MEKRYSSAADEKEMVERHLGCCLVVAREIETLGSPDPYHLRVTTYNETFTFDLKSPLDPKVYDCLWKKIHRLKNAQAPERKIKEHSNEQPS